MQIFKTEIKDLIIFKPTVFTDNRGHFFESFSQKIFDTIGTKEIFVQDNESLSNKNVLRGLHFQNPPFAQGKLVRVISGSVIDVAVDLRQKSPTYGKWVAVELNQTNKNIFWIPTGFAHGFLSLQNNTILNYKCTQYYNQSAEDSIRWNDETININWNIKNPILSQKDLNAKLFKNFVTPF